MYVFIPFFIQTNPHLSRSKMSINGTMVKKIICYLRRIYETKNQRRGALANIAPR
jgi:hypothetical protein